MKSVWIVDDEDSIRWVLEKAMQRASIPCRSFSNAQDVLDALKEEEPEVLVSDIRMPSVSGLDLLEKVKAKYPQLPIVIMTAYSDMESAVNAFEKGAYEYLAKPFDINEAVSLISKAIEENVARKNKNPEEQTRTPEILGKAPAMQEVFKSIGKLSHSNATVLITGESGTGKELVARALHNHSQRKKQPFVALNMAAIPRDLLESDLFGHEKGAFTGAQGLHRGRFEQAEGGTLFLDEIGDMPLDLQTRLLRVLSDGHFYRVGGNQSIKSDVRIIAATHQNLEKLVEQGLFRDDLYHRLNVIRLRLPTLSERAEDIPLLVNHFFAKNAKQLSTVPKRLTKDAMRFLQSAKWKGNVRQLENLCYWFSVMAPSQVIELKDLPSDFIKEQSDAIEFAKKVKQNVNESWDELLEKDAFSQIARGKTLIMNELTARFERAVIGAALRATKGRKQDAARLLGIGRNTITRKIQELSIRAVENNE